MHTVIHDNCTEYSMSTNSKSAFSKTDFLTEILETTSLPISFAGRLNLTAPWGIDLPEGYATIFCVSHGEFYLVGGENEDVTRVKTGDVVVLSPYARQRLQHSPRDNTVMPVNRLLESRRQKELDLLIPGAGGPFSMMVGAILEFNRIGSCPFEWILPPARGLYNLNEAIWTVDLSGITQAELSFYYMDYESASEAHLLPSNFTNHVGG